MTTLVRLFDATGNELYVEPDLVDGAVQQLSRDGDMLDKVLSTGDDKIELVASTVRAVANAMCASFDGLATDKKHGGSLANLEVEFGLKLSGEGRWFVAKAGGEVNITVKASWDFT